VLDEAAILGHALQELDLASAVVEVLAHHPGRRTVVRASETVVKAFATAEAAAWERECAGLQALDGSALTPELVGTGELWTATRWVEAVSARLSEVDNVPVHRELGTWLARLHATAPAGMRAWSVGDRLRKHLGDLTSTIPEAMVADITGLVEPWMSLVDDGSFVHGDWGTSNALMGGPRSPGHFVTLIDFEDAHVGDAAEDFKWQLLEGVGAEEYTTMATSYVAAGGRLGTHCEERLALAATELCLDVLGWILPEELAAPLRTRALQTLEELLDGQLPIWPPPTA
jgi:aminoglycoside phosphotransferase (APT) family kinase protein